MNIYDEDLIRFQQRGILICTKTYFFKKAEGFMCCFLGVSVARMTEGERSIGASESVGKEDGDWSWMKVVQGSS